MRTKSATPRVREHARKLRALLIAAGRKSPLRDPVATALEEAGYTPAQVHSILWTGVDGELSMSELAQRLGISEKTVTGIVDRLERDRMLLRVRCTSDRRTVQVHLTKRGEKIYAQLEAHVIHKLERFVMLLSEEELKTMFRIFTKIAAAGAAGALEK